MTGFIYTFSLCFIDVIKTRKEKVYYPLLNHFCDPNNSLKVAIDSEAKLLEKYLDNDSDGIIHGWIQQMGDSPSSFEKVEIDRLSSTHVGELVLEIVNKTVGKKQIVVDSYQNHSLPCKICIAEEDDCFIIENRPEAKVHVYDKDKLRVEILPKEPNILISNSIVASNGAKIGNSNISQKRKKGFNIISAWIKKLKIL